MAAGSSHGFFSFFTYFSNILCAVKLRVLGLMAYWYTGSAFHQIPQSYLIIFRAFHALSFLGKPCWRSFNNNYELSCIELIACNITVSIVL